MMCRITTFLLFCSLAAYLPAADPVVSITPDHADGRYARGETVTWKIKAERDGVPLMGEYSWKVLKWCVEPAFTEGKVDLATGTVTTSANDACWLMLLLNIPKPDGQAVYYNGGALVDDTGIRSTAVEPVDFDGFWKQQLATLAAIPMDAKVEPYDSGDPAVEYAKVSLANINGTRVNGLLAKPKGTGPFPGVVIYEHAGVGPLKKWYVTDFAKRGYIAFNIVAHDLPIDESADFYKQQGAGPLNNYMKIGYTNRETTYVRRMFLGTRRAIDWLLTRPELDKRTLLVSGASQGGFQSFAAAGLSPEVTHLAVSAPAGCDLSASSRGRRNGWPYWGTAPADIHPLVDECAGYYDPVFFAARTMATCLVGVGLIDWTSPASHVVSTFNALPGKKTLVSMPEAPHVPRRGEGKAWGESASKFFEAIKP